MNNLNPAIIDILDAVGRGIVTLATEDRLPLDANDINLEYCYELGCEKTSDRYFFCSILEANGEYEYTNQFLMKTTAGVDPQEKLNEDFLRLHGEGELDEEEDDDLVVYFEEGVKASNPQMKEITKEEYDLMIAYLPARTF